MFYTKLKIRKPDFKQMRNYSCFQSHLGKREKKKLFMLQAFINIFFYFTFFFKYTFHFPIFFSFIFFILQLNNFCLVHWSVSQSIQTFFKQANSKTDLDLNLFFFSFLFVLVKFIEEMCKCIYNNWTLKKCV